MLNTIYVFMALLAVMTLSISQQYGMLASREQRMKDEVFAGAYGIASERFSFYAGLSGDSLLVLDGAASAALVAFGGDTLFYTVHTKARYVDWIGGAVQPSTGATNFIEMELRITGNLNTDVEMARVFDTAPF